MYFISLSFYQPIYLLLIDIQIFNISPQTFSETQCQQNAKYSNVIHHLNVRQQSKDGQYFIHYFEIRPNQSEYIDQLKSFAWHCQKKFLNPAEYEAFMDFDLGFLALVGSAQMEMEDQKREFIESDNLTFSASLKQNSDLLTSRIGPCLPNPSQEEYFALWVYHLLESKELVEERTQEAINRHQQVDQQEQAAGIRRIFEHNEEGHARPIGDIIYRSGREPQSRLDLFLKREPMPYFVFDSNFAWYNDPHAKGSQLTQETRMFCACPTMDYISRACERVFNLRRARNNRDELLMPCSEFWRYKRRQIEDAMIPEKRRKMIAIKKKLRKECTMELASDIRKHHQIERWNFMYERNRPLPNQYSNCSPIGDQITYSGRCFPQANQLRLCEIQISPSMEKARQTDEFHTSASVLNQNPPMIFLLSQFNEREGVSDPSKTNAFPQYFETRGHEDRHINSCELIMLRNDELIPKDLARFTNDEDAYDDRIGGGNFQMAPVNPTNRKKFRYIFTLPTHVLYSYFSFNHSLDCLPTHLLNQTSSIQNSTFFLQFLFIFF